MDLKPIISTFGRAPSYTNDLAQIPIDDCYANYKKCQNRGCENIIKLNVPLYV